MTTNSYATLTTEQIYAKLTIANGETIEINGDTYTCINSVSNSNNGYQGFAYKNNSTGNIIVVHAGSNDLSKISNWFTNETFNDWIKTDGQLATDTIPSQFYSAKNFLENVISSNQQSNISQTGQSLG